MGSAAINFVNQYAQVILKSLGDPVIAVDLDNIVRYLNPSCTELTGIQFEEAEARPVNDVLSIVDSATREPVDVALLMTEAIRVGSKKLPPGCLFLCKDGTEIFVEDSIAPIIDESNAAVGAVMVLRDSSESWEKIQRLTHSVEHDHLTDLKNADSFAEHVRRVIRAADEKALRFAVLFIDLDNFKEINDDLGHSIGDGLLIEVAQRLVSSARSLDVVSRRGGDEFNILLSEVDVVTQAADATERILASLSRPFHIGGREINCSASIGISLFPRDGTDIEALLHTADAAMYDAKSLGKNRFCFYSADSDD